MNIKVISKDLKELELKPNLYSKAFDLGMTLSQYLEQMSPTESGDKLDAYERLLKRQGINIQGDPKSGIPAGTGRLFLQSDDNTVLFPEFFSRAARVAQIDTVTAVLSDLAASVIPIPTGAVIRDLYIDQTSAQKKKDNVAEGTEIPLTKITWSDKTARGGKTGIGLEYSYEFLQQVALPVLETAIAGIIQQNSLDDIADVIAVLRDGDGETKEGGAITKDNLSTYGVDTPTDYSDLTYTAWIWWLLDMLPYHPTTVILSKEGYAKLMNTATPSNTLPIFLYNQIALGQTGAEPTPQQGLRIPNPLVTVSSEVDNNTIMAVDKRFALQAYTYAGLDITETQKVISRQVNQIYMTTAVFYSCIFRAAVKILHVAG